MARGGLVVALLASMLAGCDQPHGTVVDGPVDKETWDPALVASLTPLSSLGDNAVRVTIQPSFSDYFYAIDFAPQPKSCLTPHGGTVDEIDKVEHRFCKDVLVTYRVVEKKSEEEQPAAKQWTFHLPVEDWRNLAEGLDRRMDRWRGAACCMTDGTSTAVERALDGKLRSVENNAGEYELESLGNPAWFAQTEVQRLLLLYGPAGVVPRATDWTVYREDDPLWPCSPAQFATPDPDGWGVGEDRCAQWLRQRR